MISDESITLISHYSAGLLQSATGHFCYNGHVLHDPLYLRALRGAEERGRAEEIVALISEEEIKTIVNRELLLYERAVMERVKPELDAHQMGALVSLAYDIGLKHFTKSKVLSVINSGNVEAGAEHFLTWNKMEERGQLVDCGRINARRKAERHLFLNGTLELF